jgi:hypothetical protein|tara:strand:+ start:337 stop:516 length:180 start_codon:yes stop_codon:yes gene_type:complete
MKFIIQINGEYEIDKTYEADSKAEALEKFAYDAGPCSYAELKKLFPYNTEIVIELGIND